MIMIKLSHWVKSIQIDEPVTNFLLESELQGHSFQFCTQSLECEVGTILLNEMQ